MKRCRPSGCIVGEFFSAINYHNGGYGKNGARESIMKLMIQYDTLLRMHSDLTRVIQSTSTSGSGTAPCPQDCARGTEERMGAHDEGDLEGKAPRPVPERVRAEREQ